MKSKPHYPINLSHTFQLTDEQRFALIDIARYGDINVAGAELREQLLTSLAEAAVIAMYGPDRRPTPADLESSFSTDFEPCDQQLALTFVPLIPLPNQHQELNKQYSS